MLLFYGNLCHICLTDRQAARGDEQGRHESRRTTAMGPGAQATDTSDGARSKIFSFGRNSRGGSLSAPSRSGRSATGRSRGASSASRCLGSPPLGLRSGGRDHGGKPLPRRPLLGATASHEIRRNALKWLDSDSDLGALVPGRPDPISGACAGSQIRTQHLDKSRFGLGRRRSRWEGRLGLHSRFPACDRPTSSTRKYDQFMFNSNRSALRGPT
jgi:hypothetical protein